MRVYLGAVGLLLAAIAPAIGQEDIARQQLIEEGRRLFFEETFGGNGRTCGTCHPATHNFTIDAEFIQQLHEANPNDPLFVAEFNPDLAALENPTLMLEQGLILENLDGFDQVGVMRGVPHILGLRTSIAPDADADLDQVTADGFQPANALGWSADGSAPPDGSMRDFAVGAVMQHFPLTLNRVEGVDFRLPTEEELDALEAFQLSIGRQFDLDIELLTMLDPAAERGRLLFLGDESTGVNRACAACHANAGANNVDDDVDPPLVFNDNFDTGVVNDGPNDPPDDGFGVNPEGNGTFNTPPLIEAADTAPFFHNGSRQTLEEAIEFYTDDAFANSPSGQNGGAFNLDDQDVADIAAFLRALNARENALMAATNVEELLQQRSTALLPAALADAQDGLEVLQASNIAPEAQSRFTDAVTLLSNPAPDTNTLVLADLFLRAAVQNLVPEVPGMTVEEEIVSRRNPQPLPLPEDALAAAVQAEAEAVRASI